VQRSQQQQQQSNGINRASGLEESRDTAGGDDVAMGWLAGALVHSMESAAGVSLSRSHSAPAAAAALTSSPARHQYDTSPTTPKLYEF